MRYVDSPIIDPAEGKRNLLAPDAGVVTSRGSVISAAEAAPGALRDTISAGQGGWPSVGEPSPIGLVRGSASRPRSASSAG